MQHDSIAGFSFKTIAGKIVPVLFLTLVIWFVINVLKYPFIQNKAVNWEQVYLDTFSFAILSTIIIEFKRIRKMITLIRQGEI